MTGRPARWVAWSLWLVAILTIGGLAVVGEGDSDVLSFASGALFIVAFVTTGALVASRVPRNPVGWLLCAAALCFAVGAVCEEVVARAGQGADPGVLAVVAGWVQLVVWMLGIGPAATFLLLLFPDGHLPSPRWRVVGQVAGVGLVATTVGSALVPGPIDGTTMVNRLGVPAWLGGPVRTLEGAGLVLILGGAVLSGASLVARYRAAGHHERHQLQWLAYSVPVVLVAWAGAILAGLLLEGRIAVQVSNALVTGGLVAVPLAIGVAMLRHRLYDIEVVVNRTLVYGALTTTLAVVYLASVLVLRLALAPVTGDSELAVAASTLAVAALFGPLRRRIQRVVDRRFHRRRYDAAQTLHAFAGRQRQQVDLQTTMSDLRRVVREALQPEHLSVWLRPDGTSSGNDSRTPGP